MYVPLGTKRIKLIKPNYLGKQEGREREKKAGREVHGRKMEDRQKGND